MKSILHQTRSSWPRAWAAVTLLTAGGCFVDHGRPLAGDETDEQLAALMADDDLPETMRPGREPPPIPRRFCGGFGGMGGVGGKPGDVDAGVAGTGGSIGSGSGGMPVPTPPPFPTVPVVTPAATPPPVPVPVPPPPTMPPPIRPDAGVGGTGGTADDGGSGGTGGGKIDGGFPLDGPFGGQGGTDPACASQPIGFWRFDDCNSFRSDLNDSSNQFHSAFRTVDLVCATGQEGQAVSFAHKGDLVYAPDQPDFGLMEGVTVAAWIKPDKLGGTRTLFRKRDGDSSAVALILNDDRLQFIVRLTSGRMVSVSAPAQAGAWTHVAGTYDGSVLRLYVNGHEVRHSKAPGTIARGAGPLLMGNDIAGRRFQGLMDNAWFNTLAAPADTILALTCISQQPTSEVVPANGPAVASGTPVKFEYRITNNNGPSCQPVQFQVQVFASQGGFDIQPSFSFTDPVGSGATVAIPVSVTAGDLDPGSYPLLFEAFSFDRFTSVFTNATAQFNVAEPTGCHVSTGRELTIRDVSVVDDKVRTSMGGDPSDPRTGAWSFGRMMERLSPKPEDAPDVTEAMFRTFESTQTINGFQVAAREGMEPLVLGPWPRRPDGKLDLARAPMILLGIVNRLDLADMVHGKAGEGRMVFGVLPPGGSFSMEFNVILEYTLPAKDDKERQAWADAFHGLQALPFPSEEYNAALQAITDKFTGRGAMPDNPNGSALIDIRTNEIALSSIWQLREFHISPTTGFMAPATIFLTPDLQFNGGDRLGRFINANEAAVVAETHVVPEAFEDQPFLGGAVFNNGFDVWSAPGITNPEARHKFSLNTCNGCHGGETNTAFVQFFGRSPGQASTLSGFLTGVDVSDRFTGQLRHFNELGRRRALMEGMVCPPPTP
jgi:hypothetical protein